MKKVKDSPDDTVKTDDPLDAVQTATKRGVLRAPAAKEAIRGLLTFFWAQRSCILSRWYD